MKKTLILTVDFQGMPDWHVRAKNMQIGSWFEKNKVLPKDTDIVIIPAQGDTKLYWLEGVINNIKDIKILDDIKEKLKPVLEVSLGLRPKPADLIDPFKDEVRKLIEHREQKKK
jgi:hypothetical protein